MFPILYIDSAGSPKDNANVRIDVVGDLYVLRAAQVVYSGRPYSIAETSFPHIAGDMQGWLWSKDGMNLDLIVVDTAIVSFGMDPAIIAEFHQTYGDRVTTLFHTISHHHNLKTGVIVSGPNILVSRTIVSGQKPADQQTVVSQGNPKPAVTSVDGAVFPKAHANRESFQKSLRATTAQKTWDELNDQERAFVQRRLAEKMGLVKPA